MARNKIDWEKVEVDYRCGIKSLRTMAQEHECAESAIRKRATKENWPRDLAAKIKAKSEQLVRKEEVRSQVRTETVTEKLQVEIGAQLQADIIIGQRSDISKGRKLVMSLLSELEGQTDNLELYEQLAELLIDTGDDDKDRAASAKRWDAFNKAMSLGGRSSTMKSLADSLKTLVSLEREVFGINDANSKQSAHESTIDDLA
jgi:hypothetical protein